MTAVVKTESLTKRFGEVTDASARAVASAARRCSRTTPSGLSTIRDVLCQPRA